MSELNDEQKAILKALRALAGCKVFGEAPRAPIVTYMY